VLGHIRAAVVNGGLESGVSTMSRVWSVPCGVSRVVCGVQPGSKSHLDDYRDYFGSTISLAELSQWFEAEFGDW